MSMTLKVGVGMVERSVGIACDTALVVGVLRIGLHRQAFNQLFDQTTTEHVRCRERGTYCASVLVPVVRLVTTRSISTSLVGGVVFGTAAARLVAPLVPFLVVLECRRGGSRLCADRLVGLVANGETLVFSHLRVRVDIRVASRSLARLDVVVSELMPGHLVSRRVATRRGAASGVRISRTRTQVGVLLRVVLGPIVARGVVVVGIHAQLGHRSASRRKRGGEVG